MPNAPFVPHRLTLPSVLLTLALGGVAWAATDAPRGSVVLWSDDDQWVRIERQDDPAAAPNDQPVSLDTQTVTKALGALQVRVRDDRTGSETQRAVFTREELDNLAPSVAAGLAKAGPRQDLTFSTIGAGRSSGSLIKFPNLNAGRIFYQAGKVNVIFGELQGSYRKRNVFGRRDEDFTPRRQGLRGEPSRQKWTLAALPGIALQPAGGGGVREDWVTIDPASAVLPIATAPAEPRSQASAPSGTPRAPATTPAAAARAAAPTSSGKETETELERRLQTLKNLRDKGLITEEAYNAKVQQLLAEL